MKKLIAVICMFTCILSLTACTDTSSQYASDYDESTLRLSTEAIIDQLVDMDDDYLQSVVDMRNEEIASDDETALAIKASYQSWIDSKEELGAYTPQDSDECTFTYDEDGATAKLTATFENRPALVTANFNYNSQLISFSVEPVYTVWENFTNACLNTVIGMGTVFIVLIFIAFIISLFKFIHKAEMRMADRKFQKEQSQPADVQDEPVAAPAAPAVQPGALTAGETEPMDDLELVAVITAAVAASMNTSVDKLVVRSIKRRNTNKWQKA